MTDLQSTIERHVFADQFPTHADLEQAARDSLIRYARRFGIVYTGVRVTWGTKWKTCWCSRDAVPGKHMEQAFPMVTAVRVCADVVSTR